MRKTSLVLQPQLWVFCPDRLRLDLTAQLCTDGRTPKEFNCHTFRRYTALAAVEQNLTSVRMVLSPSGLFSTQRFCLLAHSSPLACQ